MKDKNKKSPFGAFIALALAVLILFGISQLPIAEMTGGKFRNFSLISDLIGQSDSTLQNTSDGVKGIEGMDPALVEAMREDSNAGSSSVKQTMMLIGDDSVCVDVDSVLIEVKPSKINGTVEIEDYTSHQNGLQNLKSALASGKLARVAVVGDSYIEGDIMTQDLRDQLQSAYGGSGVGYMNLYSEFPGFRRSVKQGGKGWKEYAINKKCDKSLMGLSQHYFKPEGKATATYKGSKSLTHTGQWSSSRFLFIAPNGGTVKAKTTGDWNTYNVEASNDVQCIKLDGVTDNFELETSSTGIVGLGVWLDDSKGISVDCMSNRGNSGMTLMSIGSNINTQMAKHIKYDLIIVEFGINAMSPGQKNYDVYTRQMVKAINKVKACNPNADILVLGIGDRGEKKGGAVHSMNGSNEMVAAQREIARQTHSLFWNTKEAMGGNDAIVTWANSGLANKDYVHLTHKGGNKLATLLATAIKNNLNR